MSDLLQKLEALSAPCRDIDAEIHHWHLDGLGTGYRQNAPLYTRSIDAAMTLVPEGGCAEINTYENPDCFVWPGAGEECFAGSGPTPAIALCIASLKARGI